jgi:hypothetical protein
VQEPSLKHLLKRTLNITFALLSASSILKNLRSKDFSYTLLVHFVLIESTPCSLLLLFRGWHFASHAVVILHNLLELEPQSVDRHLVHHFQ